MNFNLHIERLVLEGLPATGDHAGIIQQAVEAELAHRLAEAGLPRLTGGALKNIFAGQIQLTAQPGPAQTGRQIAGALHAVLTSKPVAARPFGNQGGARR